MKVLIILLLGSIGVKASDETENKHFNTIAQSVCSASIQERAKLKKYNGFKIPGSKAEAICLIIAKTHLTTCAVDTAKIYRGVTFGEKDLLSEVMKSSLQFCMNYADLASRVVTDLILNTAVSDKITLEEATSKILSKTK